MFIEGVEDSVPLERRLAYDRQRRAEKLKTGLDAATNIAAYAEQMVRSLAEARIAAANVRDEITAHVTAAQAASKRGDHATEASEMDQAAALADDLAEAEADIAELEAMVNDQLADKAAAKQMILDQARQLERLAQKDSRLVSRVRMTEMREQALELKEALAGVIPQDASNIRERALTQAQSREDRVKARGEIVDALWQQRRRTRVTRESQTSARGQAILSQVAQEVGYVATSAAPTTTQSEVAATNVAEEN